LCEPEVAKLVGSKALDVAGLEGLQAGRLVVGVRALAVGMVQDVLAVAGETVDAVVIGGRGKFRDEIELVVRVQGGDDAVEVE